MPLGQDVVEPGSSDILDLTLYRYEKDNPWWVNLGLPWDFFKLVQPKIPGTAVYTVHGIEYGVGASYWWGGRLQTGVQLPFESNTFTDLNGASHGSVRPGDLKVGATFLGVGERTAPIRVGVTGTATFPTGTSPFRIDWPLLATGTGVNRFSAGLWSSQRLGRFSFFQWINYEKSGAVSFDRFGDSLVPGSRMQWPDRILAGLRAEWLFFRRGEREATLVGEMRYRHWGDWTVTGPLWSQDGLLWSRADRIFDGGVGLRIRTDRLLTVEGRWDYIPVEWDTRTARPDAGSIITLSLCFHPLSEGRAR